MRRGEESTAHLLKSSPGVDGKDRNARGEQSEVRVTGLQNIGHKNIGNKKASATYQI